MLLQINSNFLLILTLSDTYSNVPFPSLLNRPFLQRLLERLCRIDFSLWDSAFNDLAGTSCYEAAERQGFEESIICVTNKGREQISLDVLPVRVSFLLFWKLSIFLMARCLGRDQLPMFPASLWKYIINMYCGFFFIFVGFCCCCCCCFLSDWRSFCYWVSAPSAGIA